MNYCTYIIESELDGRYYVGQSRDCSERLIAHNLGKSKSTRPYRPWHFMYVRGFETRSEAMKHEKYLKSFKKRMYLEKYIREDERSNLVKL